MSPSTGTNGIPLGTRNGVGHSAAVRLSLLFPDGTCLHPGQVGPDRVVFREPVALKPGPAAVEIVVDAQVHRWNVVLQPGVPPSRVAHLVSG